MLHDSNGGGPTRPATPELNLYSQVIVQAVRDLDSKEEVERYESQQFFLQERGEWADMRDWYCTLLDIDPDHLVETLQRAGKLPKRRIDAMEKPQTKNTSEKVYSILPEGTFGKREIAVQLGVSTSTVNSRFQVLERAGLVTRIRPGVFARTDWFAAEQARVFAEAEAERQQASPLAQSFDVVAAVRAGHSTVRDIGFAFDGEIGYDGIRDRLKKAEAAGLVAHEGAEWQLTGT